VTVDASAPSEGDAAGAPAAPFAPPATVEPPSAVLFTRAPRAGESTPGWLLVHSVVWIAAAVAVGSIWKTSDQLGMSTWWLGPRGDPRPIIVQVLPFVPAVAMLLLTINRVRHLAWWGLLASTLMIAVGVVDLGFKVELGLLEIAIGVASALASLASFVGAYRPDPPDDHIDPTPDGTAPTTA
jgi:hypothetical protein